MATFPIECALFASNCYLPGRRLIRVNSRKKRIRYASQSKPIVFNRIAFGWKNILFFVVSKKKAGNMLTRVYHEFRPHKQFEWIINGEIRREWNEENWKHQLILLNFHLLQNGITMQIWSKYLLNSIVRISNTLYCILVIGESYD